MFSVTDTIRESLKLAWQHKIFWVFALLVASSSGNFNSFNNNDFSSSDNKSLNKIKETIENSSPDSKSTPELVAAQVKSSYSDLTNEFLSKSIGYIIFIVIAVVVIVLFGIGLGLFVQSWATGALIGGVDDVLNNKSYTLFSLASWGRKSVKQLFKYNIYVAILSFVIVFLGIVIPVVMLATGITSLEIIGGITLFVAVIGFIVFLILVSFGGNFATRFIVLNGENYKSAFKSGINTFRKNVGVTFKLAFANCLVVFVFMLVVGGVLFGVFGAMFVVVIPAIIAAVANSPVLMIVFGVLGVVLGIPLLLGFIALMFAFSGFITTYTMFTYHKLYRFVLGIDKGKETNTIDVFGSPQPTTIPNQPISEGGTNAE